MFDRRVLWTMLGLVALSACGKPGVQLGNVEGTIKMGGQPLQSALVRFLPAQGGRSSQGITDSNGHYVLDYSNKKSGALVGESKVLITTGSLEDTSGKSEKIAPKYNLESTLVVNVKRGENTFDFEVEPK